RSLKKLDFVNVVRIGQDSFIACTSLEEVQLSGLVEIGDLAFYRCTALRRISFTDSLREIGRAAFADCESLREVLLPEGIRKIARKAFVDCKSLERINIPSAVALLSAKTLEGCSALRDVVLREGLRKIGEMAFADCTSLESITIPSTVACIEKKAFQDCTLLKRVTLSEGICHIEEFAFDGCSALPHISIPDTAFVIELDTPTCSLASGSMEPDGEKLVVSSWSLGLHGQDLASIQSAISGVLNRQEEMEKQKIQLIRQLIRNLELVEASTILELALWKAKIDKPNADADMREDCRRNCGAPIIVPNVLSYLNIHMADGDDDSEYTMRNGVVVRVGSHDDSDNEDYNSDSTFSSDEE
ncbi:hypothetical protein ACHAWF_002048, partial [Thalassiosira exigua]